jgi:hypothetical protein
VFLQVAVYAGVARAFDGSRSRPRSSPQARRSSVKSLSPRCRERPTGPRRRGRGHVLGWQGHARRALASLATGVRRVWPRCWWAEQAQGPARHRSYRVRCSAPTGK